MASKVSALTAITSDALSNADLVPVVDVSDTTMAASGSTKKATVAELAKRVHLSGPAEPVILSRNIGYAATVAPVSNSTSSISSHPSVGATVDANGATCYMRFALADEFDSIQIGIPNWHTADVSGVKTAIQLPTEMGTLNSVSDVGLTFTAASTPYVFGKIIPMDTTGNPVPVTFGGGATSTPTFPARKNSFTPSITWSDWMPASSATRTDGGGASGLLDVIMFFPAATQASIISGLSVAQLGRTDKWTAGRAIRTWWQVGDKTGTVNAFTATATWYTTIPIIINYKARNQAARQVVIVGDSIYEGSGCAFTNWTFGIRSVFEASTSSNPIEVCVATKISAGVANQRNMLDAVLSQVRPHVLVAEMLTPNSYVNSADTRNASWMRGLVGGQTAAVKAARNGAKVLGVGFAPFASMDATGDTSRIAANVAVGAQIVADGGYYFDPDPYVTFSLGASPRRLTSDASSGGSGDGTHWQDFEHTAVVAAFKPVLLTALAAAV